MKIFNRKGFTLIELLAVIVVLAIVLVVTIPSVLRSVDSAREKSLENSANAIADWLTRQSELAAIADTGIVDDEVDSSYVWLITKYPDIFNTVTDADHAEVFWGTNGEEDRLLKAAGFGGGTSELEFFNIWYNGSRICVRLAPDSSTSSTSRFKDVGIKISAGCE